MFTLCMVYFRYICCQVLMAHSAHLALSLYAILCIACATAVYFLPIETKGRALQVSFSWTLFYFCQCDEWRYQNFG